MHYDLGVLGCSMEQKVKVPYAILDRVRSLAFLTMSTVVSIVGFVWFIFDPNKWIENR